MSFKLSLAVTKDRVFDTCGKLTLPKSFQNKYQINPGEKAFCVLGINPERMYTLEWGLIPHWSKTLNNRRNLTEIHSVGAINKPSSRIPFREKRGYILVDGIYYLKKKGLDFVPYRITRQDGKLMRLACLWDEWKQGDKYLSTVAMMTQRVNHFISPEFPVELTDETFNDWMHHEDINMLDKRINEPINIDKYIFYKVSDQLLDPTTNSPELYKDIPEELTLFSHL